jgi:hypothetical protein
MLHNGSVEHPAERELDRHAREIDGKRTWVSAHVEFCIECQEKILRKLSGVPLTMTQAVWASRR